MQHSLAEEVFLYLEREEVKEAVLFGPSYVMDFTV